jgi:hypothetical protein
LSYSVGTEKELSVQSGRLSFGLLVCLAIYFAGAAGMVFWLASTRAGEIEELSTLEQRAHWQEWKSAAARQDGTTGPVARREPKSDEPPTLVLLRDHFAVIVVASLTFYTFLFALAVFLGRGIMRSSRVALLHAEREDESSRGLDD